MDPLIKESNAPQDKAQTDIRQKAPKNLTARLGGLEEQKRRCAEVYGTCIWGFLSILIVNGPQSSICFCF